MDFRACQGEVYLGPALLTDERGEALLLLFSDVMATAWSAEDFVGAGHAAESAGRLIRARIDARQQRRMKAAAHG